MHNKSVDPPTTIATTQNLTPFLEHALSII